MPRPTAGSWRYSPRLWFALCGGSELDGGDVDEFVDNGVDGEPGGGVDLQLAGDVAPVGDDGVDGDAEPFGYLLVLQALDDADDDLLLALAERLAVVLSASEDHLRDVFREVVLTGQTLQTHDGGGEDVVLDLGVLAQPFLVVVDVVEGGRELVVVEGVGGEVLDDHELELAQRLVGLLVVFGEGLDVVVADGTALEQRLDVGEEGLLLVLHVAAYLLGVFFVEAHDEAAQGVAGADALLQFATDEGELEVEVVGVAGLEVVEEGGDADAVVVLEVGLVVDGEVDDGQEGVGVYVVHLAGLADGLVAEAEVDAEGAQGLQYAVVVLDEGDHLVTGFVHLEVLHDCERVSGLRCGRRGLRRSCGGRRGGS